MLMCVIAWMFFWNSNNLETSNIFVIINTLAQLGYIATALEPLDTRSTPNFLTHIVAKTFAGIGVLDLLHNTAAAYYVGVEPSQLVHLWRLLGVRSRCAGVRTTWELVQAAWWIRGDGGRYCGL
jgi:hypothetical protein